MDLAEMAGRSEELKLSIADLKLAASTVETIALVKKSRSRIYRTACRKHAGRQTSSPLSCQISIAAPLKCAIRAALWKCSVRSQARQTFVTKTARPSWARHSKIAAYVPEEFDLETSHARVEELRTRLEGFGGVNMMALEELAEAEERCS